MEDDVTTANEQRPNWPLPSFDAADWAAEFMRLFGDKRDKIDEGLMIGWFANALMRGYDEHAWRVDKCTHCCEPILSGETTYTYHFRCHAPLDVGRLKAE